MAGEWRTATVGDVAIRVTKGTTPTTIGGRFVDRGISFVKVESITDDGRIDMNTLARIDEATNALLSRSVLEQDDILFTIAGTIGRAALVPAGLLPANTNQAVAIVRPNPQAVLPRFLYYVLSDESRVRQAHTRVVQSVQANFSLSELSSLEIPVPPLPEQRAIAHILGTLDDKIELNRRMNETLEAIALALFKSWFVDFDPVRTKVDGRDPGIPGQIAKLFPDSFEESELGKIPRGWHVTTIEAIATRVGMGPFGSSIKVESFVPNGVPIISGQHLRGFMVEDTTFNFVAQEHANKLMAANVQRGDVVFTHAGNIGQVAYIPEHSRYDRYVISQRQFFMRCDQAQVSPSFVTFYFRSPEGRHRLLANASSSGVPSIARPVTYLRSIRLTIPPKAIMGTFEKLIQPLLTQFRHRQDEGNTLVALRDALLPKLISGEVRVKHAEGLDQTRS